MLFNKKTIKVFLQLVLINVYILNIAYADKSLYVVSDTNSREVQAYSIDGSNLTYQTDYITNSNHPIAVAIDSSEYGQFLFITFEGENEIELVNAQTMKYIDVVEVPDPQGHLNLAGIVVDIVKRKVYVIDRGTNHLYVYSWDAEYKELSPDYPVPYYVELEDCYQGYDLALDDENHRLYVGDNTTTVKYYDANDVDWPKIGTFSVSHAVVGISVDVNNQFVYTGNGIVGGGSFLSQYDLSTDTEIVEDIGSPVLGISVDQKSSLIYLTTYSSGAAEDELLVYSSFTNNTGEKYIVKVGPDPIVRLGSPAGVCVPCGDISFVPPFVVNKQDNIEDCVQPRDGQIEYTICYEYQWTDPCDPDPCDFDSLTIIEYLADDVEFISASAGFLYYPYAHKVMWLFDPFDPETDPCCVGLTVEVNEKVAPGGVIENRVDIVATITIDEQEREYFDTDIIYTDACYCGDTGDIIYVDKDATAGAQNGSSWYDAFLNLDAGLEIATVCDQIWVAGGTYKPTDDPCDPNATFQLVNAVAVYGGFAGLGANDPNDRNWMIYETILSGDIVGNDNDASNDPNLIKDNINDIVSSDMGVKVAILDGFVINRGLKSGVVCEDSGIVTISHNRITRNEKGIYCHEAYQPIIENNWIYRNVHGIYMEDPNAVITIGHCTVANNHQDGIYFDGMIDPVITNSIIWGHSDEDNDLIGCDATYSCIEYPDCDPNTGVIFGIGNIDDDPCFVDSENDDYHLDWDSPCIDTGDPGMYYGGKRDIDKHWRKIGLWTDMDADEYKDCCYVSPADFNEDEIVNLLDFCDFSAHWLYTSNDQGWDDLYDLDEDGTIIDIADFALFAEDWLWMSCAKMVSLPMDLGKTMAMGMPDGQKSTVLSISTDKKVASPPPEPIIEIKVTEELLNDGTKIELLAYPTGELLAKIVTDPRGNITHFIVYLDDGNRVEINCTYDSIGNETSATYTHYDADDNIILIERMEDDMLLIQDE